MSGLVAYVGFIGAFSVVAITLYYGLRAIKFI
ncbi:cytochrome b6-f complex subunit PetL [Geminocystis sp. CENA526]